LGLWEISQTLNAYEHYESSSAWNECGGGDGDDSASSINNELGDDG
jgi:hypothetical protein